MTIQHKLINRLRTHNWVNEKKNEVTIATLIIAVMCISTLLTPHFLKLENLLNLFRQTSYTAIAAMGMFFVILIGGIDLSIGATMQVIGMVAIIMLTSGFSVIATLIVVLLIAVAIGLINGILVTYGKLQPFIVTLVMQNILNGTVLVVTKAGSISGSIPKAFMNIGTGYIWIFPIPAVFMLFILVITMFIMSKTILGRKLYVIGSNKTAAYNCGINVKALQILAYILCALFAMISGILSVARVGAFQPSTSHGGAVGRELDAIAAVVIGGASLMGGKGTILGSVLGALLYGTLSNLFPLIGVNSYFQQLLQGIIIVFAVLISTQAISLKNVRKISEGKKGTSTIL